MEKTQRFDRKLVFENGREFLGAGFGSPREALYQCSFDTAMIGYQEILSDPACAGEALVMTYPVIGSYGMADEDYESRACYAGCLIVRRYNDRPSNFRYTKTLEEVMVENDIPGIQGVDTRAIGRMLRDEGSMKVLLTDKDTSLEKAMELIRQAAPEEGLAKKVGGKKIRYSRTANFRYNVAAVDCGIRQSSIRCLNKRGCNVTIVPQDITAEELKALKPDGLFLSSGPGDPKECEGVIALVKEMWGKMPIFGVGLGCQIIALAAGGDTYQMKHGHNGGNVPVKTIYGDKREITSQSHSFAICEKSLENTSLQVTHRHLLDDTVEGIMEEKSRVIGVQHYPENEPGADDCAYVYDTFITMMDNAKEGGSNNA